MQADEQRVHDRLMAHRRELVDPKIRLHYGRVVKYTGDGFLAEFPSVIEAVLCAVEVQCGMHHRNVAVAPEQRMRFRIGINLGDVIAEPEDIYGDGVNIAARLEAMAEPNGICISHVVHEQVRDKLPFEFVDLGPRAAKNIVRPLHAFALGADVIAALPPPVVATPPLPTVDAPEMRAPRLSIVVLPFHNLGGNDDRPIILPRRLPMTSRPTCRASPIWSSSREHRLQYIAANRPDVRRIGRELNVRYLLEGSIRRLESASGSMRS